MRTVGHGTLDATEFATLVKGAEVDLVVDVRRYPGSRRFPHFARPRMEQWLPDQGVDYRWMPALGGRRTAGPDSPHTALRNEQFRAYADHMESPEFAGAVSGLFALGEGRVAAVMCAESVWWRCHRRLLADYLVLVEEIGVGHLFRDGRVTTHEPTTGVRLDGRRLVYDAVEADQSRLFTEH